MITLLILKMETNSDRVLKDTKGQILCNSTYMRCPEKPYTKGEGAGAEAGKFQQMVTAMAAENDLNCVPKVAKGQLWLGVLY